jgi:hypothetical protein
MAVFAMQYKGSQYFQNSVSAITALANQGELVQ